MFKNIFKKKENKKIELSKEEFGKLALSRLLLTNAQNSPDLFKELNMEIDFIHYLLYLEFILFISKKLLEEKYSSQDADVIINSTIDGITLFMANIPDETRDDVNKHFRKMFAEFEEDCKSTNCDVYSEQGLRNLATSFLEWCGIEHCILGHTLVFTHLSSFIIHHLGGVIGSDFTII